jgi:thiol-disulfide isomerase/thioredoxin
MKAKKLFLWSIILLVFVGCGKKNYYSLHPDSFLSEFEIRNLYDSLRKNVPDGYCVNPVVYHKIENNDSIINYLRLDAVKSTEKNCDSTFNPVFQQDVLFLLLNQKLPSFKLNALNGDEFSSSQLIGKPALINYWSPACSFYEYQVPQLNGLKQLYGDKMHFVAITESGCNQEQVTDFLYNNPFSFLILKGGDTIKNLWKIQAIPVNLFIDKTGHVRYILGSYPLVNMNNKKGENIPYDKDFVAIIEKLINEL